jgi:hypothetical protein
MVMCRQCLNDANRPLDSNSRMQTKIVLCYRYMITEMHVLNLRTFLTKSTSTSVAYSFNSRRTCGL